MSKNEKRKQYQKAYQDKYRKTYTDKRNRLYMSLNESYYQKLEYLAKQDQVKPIVKAKMLLQNAINKQNPNHSQAVAEELRQTKLLIRKIGTNINQIAHRSNTLQVMVDEQGLLMHLQALEDTIASYVSEKTK